MKALPAAIDRLVEAIVIACFFAIVVVGAAQIFNRYFLNLSLSWSEEFQRYGQIWMVFLGIPVAYRRGMHIGMDTLHAMLPQKDRRYYVLVIDLLWMVLAVALLIGTFQLMRVLQFQRSPGLGLPMSYVYGGVLGGGFYMAFVGLRRIVANLAGNPPGLTYGLD
ncbi:MAG: TRAP transporter small permease [Bauldia sp.]|nr:TRAP transporter small permease [Bauldia sp.]